MSNITVNQTSNASIGECMFDDGNSVKSVEILYLTIVSLIGTLGNCLVIFSIIYGRAVNKNGNIFLINLAISDLLVCFQKRVLLDICLKCAVTRANFVWECKGMHECIF